MTRLCVPLTASTVDQMIADLDLAASSGADMIELRLDYLHEYDDASLRRLMAEAARFPIEVIATCRIANEGGRWEGDEMTRVSLLEAVGLLGPHYLDFEYAAWQNSANVRQKIGLVCEVNSESLRPRHKLILSAHDFEKTPTDLPALLAKMRNEPCHVVKLACKANHITDALAMLDAVRESAKHRPTIGLSMGEAGIISRILARKCGADLTFASLAGGKESAPGQIPVSDMRTLYRWDSIDAATQVYGVIGCPVAHSMSPAIFNASFAATSHNAVYLPLRVEPAYEDFAAFIDGCIARPWLDLRGCSVTIPHKQNLLRYVEEHGGFIEPLAARIGAANTLVLRPPDAGHEPHSLAAYNTDYRGAMDALIEGIGGQAQSLRDAEVLVLGAGGASRAIVAGLHDAGCRITICNRTASKAEQLAADFQATAITWERRHDQHPDILVQCTSIGMWPKVDESPLEQFDLPARTVVFETIYNPLQTKLLMQAGARGCRTINGAAMFINQAAAQYRLWTGRDAPRETMRQVVLTRLRG